MAMARGLRECGLYPVAKSYKQAIPESKVFVSLEDPRKFLRPGAADRNHQNHISPRVAEFHFCEKGTSDWDSDPAVRERETLARATGPR
jgi:hypothetical protein